MPDTTKPSPTLADKNPQFILGVVGTDHHPFDRFVEWIDRWHTMNAGCEVFVQRGSTDQVPTAPSAKWLDPAELEAMMHRADAIVCHGGPSTIMEARHAGLVPIVVPRDPSRGEHVDDHQLRFTDFLAAQGAILVARNENELGDHLRTVTNGGIERVPAGSPTPTLERISTVIDELMERPSRPLLAWSRRS